jgi:hypothetical protein
MNEQVGLLVSADVIPARTDKRTGESKEAIGLIEVATGENLNDRITQVWLSESLTRAVMRLKKFESVVIRYEIQQYRGNPQLRAVAVVPVSVASAA